MPRVRGQNERPRDHGRRLETMAVHVLRRDRHAQNRFGGKRPGSVPGLALLPTPQASTPGGGRTFRRKAERYWRIWPVAPACDEVHHVVHVDGIWLLRPRMRDADSPAPPTTSWAGTSRGASARPRGEPSCRVRRSRRGGLRRRQRFEKARRDRWPQTRVQRCTFHAFCRVKRCTTARPNLQAGVELYSIAKELPKVEDADDAARWLASFARWRSEWDAFLGEKAVVDGRSQFKRQRLRRAEEGRDPRAAVPLGLPVHVPRPRAGGAGAVPVDRQPHRG